MNTLKQIQSLNADIQTAMSLSILKQPEAIKECVMKSVAIAEQQQLEIIGLQEQLVEVNERLNDLEGVSHG